MTQPIDSSAPPPVSAPAFSPLMIVRLLIFTLLLPVLLFVSAGEFRWIMGWIFTAVVVVFAILPRLLMLRTNPDLLQERACFTEAENVPTWDRILAPSIALIVPALLVIVAGLDRAGHWTTPNVSEALQGIALVIFVLGMGFSTWAFMQNPFFSSVVRLQKERGQQVITSGPYRFVRHPGYAGAAIGWLASPVMFGALVAFVPAICLLILYFVRTALEDETLKAELPGYADYAAKTRFRLLPGLW